MNAFALPETAVAPATEALPAFPWVTRDEVFRIETPRLWLRWARAADADRLQAIAGLEAVAGMTATWPHPLPEGEAARRIDISRLLNAAGKSLTLAITLKSDPDRLIGQVGCGGGASGEFAIGYMIDPALAGRGIASEAASGLVRAIFTHTRIGQLTATVNVTNAASKRVLEKCGFIYQRTDIHDAPARGMVTVDYFALSRADWRGRLERMRRNSPVILLNATAPGRDISQGLEDKIPI